jgi:hypothetical protein
MPKPVVHGGASIPYTFRWLAGDVLPRLCERGRRYGSLAGRYTWAQETHTGRWTVRGPDGKIVAGCSSWWRASRLAMGVEAREKARSSPAAAVAFWLERVW